MNMDPLQRWGWKPFFAQQIDPDPSKKSMFARVAAHHGSQVTMVGSSGEFRLPTQLAEAAGDLAVGDWLQLDLPSQRARRRLDRLTLMSRKAAGEEVKPQLIAANLDTVFIVSSCNEDFNLSRIERYLAIAIQADVNPVVVLTKADLVPDVSVLRKQVERLHPGLLVETLDARQHDEAKSLETWCGPGQTVALLGSSGVGKSTLANSLGVEHLTVGDIRLKDGKGRHTTTTRSLHLLPCGGVLMDTPGMRELQLPACEEGVQELFQDVIEITQGCRFTDCNHDGEPGCAVELAMQSGALDGRRYASYQKLLAEQAHHSRSLAEHRQRDRKNGRFYKSVLREKRRRREDV